MKQRKTDDEMKSRYRGVKIKGKKIDEHRYIMEQILGRKLTKDEVVHHIDGNKLNNDPSNLQVMSRAEHTRLHSKMGSYAFTEETIERLREKIKDAWKRGDFNSLKFSVCAYDKETGVLVKEYASTRAAIVDGHWSSPISNCCRGTLKSYHGMVWRYKF